MEQIIYGDILFLVNFSMDFLALYVTAKLMKLKFKLSRGFISASLGSTYGVISVCIPIGIVASFIITAVVGLAMCFILNGFNGIGILVREVSVFLAVNLVIGGGMTAIYSVFNANGGAENILIYGNPETLEQQLPLLLFAVGGVAVTGVLLLFGRGLNKQQRKEVVKVFIEQFGRHVSITGIADSGNLLIEPISGERIVIITQDIAKRLLDQPVIDALINYRVVTNLFKDRLRFVLCETISGKTMLGAFKPQCICINNINVAAWVAISDNFSKDGEKSYSAIVPAALVQDPKF